MDDSLNTRWAITRRKLNDAYVALYSKSSDPESLKSYAEYRDYLDHNELECALDCLVTVVERRDPPVNSWLLLALAAESMDLNVKAELYRKMVR